MTKMTRVMACDLANNAVLNFLFSFLFFLNAEVLHFYVHTYMFLEVSSNVSGGHLKCLSFHPKYPRQGHHVEIHVHVSSLSIKS